MTVAARMSEVTVMGVRGGGREGKLQGVRSSGRVCAVILKVRMTAVRECCPVW